MDAGEWIGLVGVAIAFLSICMVVWQLIHMNKQLMLQVYSDYTKRYQDIVLHFPENVNDPEFDLGKLDPETYAKTMRYMRVYFDLCFEEWDLFHHKKLIPSELWLTWEGGMKTAMAKPAFRQAWAVIRETSEYGATFEGQVERWTAPAA